MGRLIAERAGGRGRDFIHASSANHRADPRRRDRPQSHHGALIGNFVPAMNALAMPLLFRSIEHLQKVLDSAIGSESWAASGPMHSSGSHCTIQRARSIYNSVRPLHSVADIKGLRLRVHIGIDVRHDQGAWSRAGRAALWLSPGLRPEHAENNWPSFVASNHYKYAGFYTLTEHTMSRSAGDVAERPGKASPRCKIYRESALRSVASCARSGRGLEEQSHKRAESGRRDEIVKDFDRKPLEAAMATIYEKAQREPRRAADRTHSQGGVTSSWQRPGKPKSVEPPANLAHEAVRVVGLLRAVPDPLAPIRIWPRSSSAAMSRRRPRARRGLGRRAAGASPTDPGAAGERDQPLQNLIHRYINQPSPDLFAEDGSSARSSPSAPWRHTPRPTRCCRGRWRKFERVTDRFLNGFGDLRGVQATITKTMSKDVQGQGLLRSWWRTSRDASGRRSGNCTSRSPAMLVAANAYLRSASASAEEAQRNTETN